MTRETIQIDIDLTTTVLLVKRLDAENKNDLWGEAIQKEIKM